jgi:phage shock protein PspC (stress-responsive transcriptional regulator)
MKKTLTVNISGQVYHIDEDGYDVLQNYLFALKKHFKDQDGGLEIIDDIESRISELFGERVSSSKQGITLEDVNEVIQQLGQPFEMDSEQTKGEESAKSAPVEGEKKHRRFYRDSDRKVIGGVCSGVAAYFNIDPVLVRIVFIILFLFGGSSFWIYVILWIAIPEAKTTAEKLEMSGETVNVDNIEKKIKSEFEGIKSRIGDYTTEAKSAVNNMKSNVKPSQNSVDRVVSVFSEAVVVLARVFGILFGVCFVVFGLIFLFGLMISIFSYSEPINSSYFGIQAWSISQFLDLVLTSSTSKLSAIIGLLIVIGLPLIMIVYSGIKLIFGLNFKVRYLGLSVFFLWILGAIMLGIATFDVLIDLQKQNTEVQQLPLAQPANNQLYIALESDSVSKAIIEGECEDEFPIYGYKNEKDQIYYGIPKIIVKNATDDKFAVSVKKYARGNNAMNARQRSMSIQYTSRQSGDTLFIAPIFSWNNERFWRAQSVRVIIYCPKDKALFFTPEFARMTCLNYENGYFDSYVNKRVGVNNDELYELPEMVWEQKDSIKTK